LDVLIFIDPDKVMESDQLRSDQAFL
jgi:hypothetical protein